MGQDGVFIPIRYKTVYVSVDESAGVPSVHTAESLDKREIHLDSEGDLPKGGSPEPSPDTVREKPVDAENVSGDTDEDSE